MCVMMLMMPPSHYWLLGEPQMLHAGLGIWVHNSCLGVFFVYMSLDFQPYVAPEDLEIPEQTARDHNGTPEATHAGFDLWSQRMSTSQNSHEFQIADYSLYATSWQGWTFVAQNAGFV